MLNEGKREWLEEKNKKTENGRKPSQSQERLAT